MKKLYFVLLFLFSLQTFSQSYPYLNASTANENEFPVDKDTNIYMFNGNRLVKTDKNFNVIWANTYSGVNGFSRLLLSKTGSIYCVASASIGIVFGKINPNGSVIWFKNASAIGVTTGTTNSTAGISCNKLFLDRNNNLIVSGQTGFLKLDTNGNALKFKLFGSVWYNDGFSFLTDSAGYYKFVGAGYAGMGPGRDLGIYYYNDNTDTFTKAERIAGLGVPSCTGFGWRLISSKFNNRFYVQITLCVFSGNNSGITKLTLAGKPLWSGNFSNVHGTSNVAWGHLEESNNGDLLYQISTGNFFSNYTSAFLMIDSNGTAYTPYARSMLFNYPLGFIQPPNHSPRSIKSNGHYFDISGHYFPTNPLTMQQFNSSLSSIACGSTVSVTYGSFTLSSTFPVTATIPTITPITSYTVPVYSTSASATTFMINSNFCTVLDINEDNKINHDFEIFPNPVSENIFLNEVANQLEVIDVNGKKLKTLSNTSSVDVADLSQGIYFIRIKTDKGEFNKKFIKD